jgi:RHS repeat-associated protein
VTFYQANWQKTQIGNETPGTLSAYSNAILFGGYYRDAETGLYNVRNRYYHVQLGWLTRDPLGYVDGMSLYEYCGGGATVSVDPNGLLSKAQKIANLAGQAQFARSEADRLESEAHRLEKEADAKNDKCPEQAASLRAEAAQNRAAAARCREDAKKIDEAAQTVEGDSWWSWEGFVKGAAAGYATLDQVFSFGLSDYYNQRAAEAWQQSGLAGTGVQTASEGCAVVSAVALMAATVCETAGYNPTLGGPSVPPGFRQIGPNTWETPFEVPVPEPPPTLPPGRGPYGPLDMPPLNPRGPYGPLDMPPLNPRGPLGPLPEPSSWSPPIPPGGLN